MKALVATRNAVQMSRELVRLAADPNRVRQLAFGNLNRFTVIALILSVLASTSAVVPDTVIVLGMVERDLTGDGSAEVLRLVGVGESIDSLDVTFSIVSAGSIVYQTRLWPLTRTKGFDADRQTLTSDAHRAHLEDFAAWFFSDSKFMTPEEFVAEVRGWGARFSPAIPDAIARDHRLQLIVDSLAAMGHTRAEAETRARSVPGTSVDSIGTSRWEAIQASDVTVFMFSPGGDRVQAIAWSAQDRRFYQLVECC